MPKFEGFSWGQTLVERVIRQFNLWQIGVWYFGILYHTVKMVSSHCQLSRNWFEFEFRGASSDMDCMIISLKIEKWTSENYKVHSQYHQVKNFGNITVLVSEFFISGKGETVSRKLIVKFWLFGPCTFFRTKDILNGHTLSFEKTAQFWPLIPTGHLKGRPECWPSNDDWVIAFSWKV